MIIASLGKGLAVPRGLLGPGEVRQRDLPRRVFQAQGSGHVTAATLL